MIIQDEEFSDYERISLENTGKKVIIQDEGCIKKINEELLGTWKKRKIDLLIKDSDASRKVNLNELEVCEVACITGQIFKIKVLFRKKTSNADVLTIDILAWHTPIFDDLLVWSDEEDDLTDVFIAEIRTGNLANEEEFYLERILKHLEFEKIVLKHTVEFLKKQLKSWKRNIRMRF